MLKIRNTLLIILLCVSKMYYASASYVPLVFSNGTTAVSGINYIEVNGDITYTDLGNGEILLNVNSSPNGTVMSASSIADNALVRGNGGATGIQGSGILVDDNNNISNVNNLNVLNYSLLNNVDAINLFSQNTFINGTLTLPTGSSTGLVLTSDANGLATWQAIPSSADDLGSHIAGTNLNLNGFSLINAQDVNGVTANFTNGNFTNITTSTIFSQDSTFNGNISIPTGSATGFVLTSDANGLATWQAIPSSADDLGSHIAGTNLNLNGFSLINAQDVNGITAIFTNGNFANIITNTLFSQDSILNGNISIPTGSATGFVLTSDANGLATWQAISGVSNGAISNATILSSNFQDSTFNGLNFFTNNSTLQVNGNIIIPSGATTGFVLTTDANGLASWQAIPSSADDLGSHIAGTNLNLNGFSLINAQDVNGITANFANGNFTNITTNTLFSQDSIFNGNISIPTGSATGFVLTSDANGLATWQAIAGVSNGAISNATILSSNFQDSTFNGLNFFTNNSTLQVNGNIIIPSGATTGFVLTTDANGLATWQAIPSSADNLGSHIAGTNLNLNGFSLINAQDVNGITANFANGNFTNITTNTLFSQDSILNGNISIPNGSATGLVLTSDANGLATWQAIAGVSNGAISNATILSSNFQDSTFNGLNFFTNNSMAQFNGNISIPAGSATGFVLTSDANGLATWQAIPSSADDLGSHIAGTNLNLNGFSLINAQDVNGDTANFANGNFTNISTKILSVNGNLFIPYGSNAGFVLTSDINGNASWTDLSSLSTNGDNLGNHIATANINLNGNNLINVQQIDINGSLIYQNGASTGFVLTSDANGLATWQAIAGVSNGTISNATILSSNFQDSIFNGTNFFTNNSSLQVNGNILIPNGANTGFVLTTDANGLATWQAPALNASGANGAIQFALNGSLSSDENNFFYDHLNGNLGIGTNNPNFALEIDKDNPTIYLNNNGGTSNDHPIIRWNSNSDALGLRFYSGATEVARMQDNRALMAGLFSTFGGMYMRDFFIQRGNTGGAITMPGAGVMTFGSGVVSGASLPANEYGRFDSGGNLGLLTTTPSALLDIGGGIRNFTDGIGDALIADDLEVDGDLYVNGSLATSLTPRSVVFAGVNGALSENNNSFAWDNTNNRLGIGTNTPTAQLELREITNNPEIRLTRNGNTASIRNNNGLIIEGPAVGPGIGAMTIIAHNNTEYRTDGGSIRLRSTQVAPSSYITLETTGLERLRVASSGFTGISSPTPHALLDIGNGTANFIDGLGDALVADDLEVDGDLYVNGTLATSLTPGSVIFAGVNGTLSENNNSFVWDNTNRRLSIGKANPLYALDMNGHLQITSSTGPGLRTSANLNTFNIESTGGVGATNLRIGSSNNSSTSVYAHNGPINLEPGPYNGGNNYQFSNTGLFARTFNLAEGDGNSPTYYIQDGLDNGSPGITRSNLLIGTYFQDTQRPAIQARTVDANNSFVGFSNNNNFIPSAKVHVQNGNLFVTNGDIVTEGFIMPTGAANGLVLVSDANGVASWQIPPTVTASGVNGAIQFSEDGVLSSNGNTFYWDINNGRLGIGTNIPSATLQVNGAINLGNFDNTIYSSTSNDVAVTSAHLHAQYGLWARDAVSRSMGIDGNTNSMDLYTAGTAKMNINSTGNVGIGFSSSAAKLSINGDLLVQNGSTLNGTTLFTNNSVAQFNGGINIPSGAVQDYVLTSDANGNANWRDISYVLTNGGAFLGALNDAISDGNSNLFLGNGAGLAHTGINNTGVGINALRNVTAGNGNTVLGFSAFTSLNSGSNNIALGDRAGNGMVSGDNNIFIGTTATGTFNGTSNELNIGDRIFGDLANGFIAINDNNPLYELQVNGTTFTKGFIMPTGAANGLVLVSDANGVATWQIPPTVTASGTNGAIQFSEDGVLSSNGSRFYWDDNNGRLGIGNNNPQYTLEVGSQTTTAYPARIRINDNSDNQQLIFSNGNQNRFMVRNSGTVLGFLSQSTGAAGVGQSFLFTGGTPDTGHLGSLFRITGNYNNAGQRIDGLDVNITNTSSAANSSLANFKTNGNSKLFVDVSGNVGINNTTPNSMLAINLINSTEQGLTLRAFNGQTANLTEWTANDSSRRISIGSLANNDMIRLYSNNNAHRTTLHAMGDNNSQMIEGTYDGNQTFLINYDPSLGTNTGNIIRYGTRAGSIFQPGYEARLHFRPRGLATNTMTLDENGNVGIGKIANPNIKLDVNGALAIRDGSQANGFVLTSDANGIASWQAITNTSTASGANGSIQFALNGSLASDSTNFHWDNTNNRLGLGTNTPATTLEVNGALSFASEVNNGVSGAGITINFSSSNKQRVTLNANTTLTLNAPGVGNYLLKVVQDATGSRTATWAAASGLIRWPSGIAPTLSSNANAVDIVSCYYDGTDYFCLANLNFI